MGAYCGVRAIGANEQGTCCGARIGEMRSYFVRRREGDASE